MWIWEMIRKWNWKLLIWRLKERRLKIRVNFELDSVAQAWNAITWGAEAVGSGVQGQPGLCRKTLYQNKQTEHQHSSAPWSPGIKGPRHTPAYSNLQVPVLGQLVPLLWPVVRQASWWQEQVSRKGCLPQWLGQSQRERRGRNRRYAAQGPRSSN